jgi:integrase
MPRPATGQVIERRTRSGLTSYSLRFRAYGRREFLHLGYAPDWTRKRAEGELSNVMADVRRGLWRPPELQAPPAPAREVPTFHVFASEWFADRLKMGGRHGRGLSDKGRVDLEWRLCKHLLPHFAAMRLDAITVEDVDAFRRRKAAGGDLSPSSVNKLIRCLAAIMDQAVEYGHVDRNPAKGKRRLLTEGKPRRTRLQRADHITALLDAVGALDGSSRTSGGSRRAAVATLVFAGLRIGELLDLRWRDVDLARGTITVRASKTDAGERTITILPALGDELRSYRARCAGVDRMGLVFATSTGGRQSESNLRNRVLAPAVEAANARLEREGEEPMPPLTPHSLRRTFASILVAIGEPPTYAMRQLGHTNAAFTLSVYAEAMDARDGELERIKALVKGQDWAPSGTSGALAESQQAVETVS